MGWIDNRIAEYYQWLKDNTAIREDKGTGWFSVSTPFVGLFNDKSSRRKTKQFSSYFRFPTSHTTVRAVPHTAVPILGAIRDMNP